MLTEMPVHYAGGGFPWGLLIIGGIIYFLWSKGVIGGPGRHGGRHGGGYGPGYGPGSGPPQMPATPGASPERDFGFRGPRDVFEEWHRQAHDPAAAQPQMPSAPPAPPAPAAPPAAQAPASGEGEAPR